MPDLPLPGSAPHAVAIPAPGTGPGYWAGAPSAVVDDDGSIVLAYRLRSAGDRGLCNVIARSEDGETFETIARVDKHIFPAESLERPALVRANGRWRLYACCATPDSKHWRIDMLEADDPAGLAGGDPRTVFEGDEDFGVKDPVI